MKQCINPVIRAHLVRRAFYLILLVAVCVIPFALGQRATTKQSAVADPLLLGSGPLATLSIGDDPASGTWTVTGSLNTARDAHTATLLPNGMVLVAGGIDSNLNPLNSAELYDPASGTWTVTDSLNTARYYHTATLLSNGMVLIAGGIDSLNHLDSAELYDPASGTWTVTGSLNSGHVAHTATLLPNGMVLVAGGFDNTFIASASAELYDPASGTWTVTGSLNTPRAFQTATLLPNGMVLVTGGHDGPTFTPSDVLSSTELYDPVSGSWTVTGSLNSARYHHTATFLSNGVVLVAGGIGGFNAFASAELYSPASRNWTVTGSLNTARFLHTATLLPNGMVLVAAGESSSNASFPLDPDRARSWSLGTLGAGCCFIFPVASAELYTPGPTPTPTPCTGRCEPTPRPRSTPHPRPTAHPRP